MLWCNVVVLCGMWRVWTVEPPKNNAILRTRATHLCCSHNALGRCLVEKVSSQPLGSDLVIYPLLFSQLELPNSVIQDYFIDVSQKRSDHNQYSSSLLIRCCIYVLILRDILYPLIPCEEMVY